MTNKKPDLAQADEPTKKDDTPTPNVVGEVWEEESFMVVDPGADSDNEIEDGGIPERGMGATDSNPQTNEDVSEEDDKKSLEDEPI